MDKARDVKRRGASRFKHSKPKLTSGLVSGVREDLVVFSEKSRRDKKLRKLSSVVGNSSSSHEGCEMDSLGTSRDDDELRSVGNINNSKRLTVSDKFFDDCNGVGHASVPRRLRTAMKKRSCDSISPRLPDLKKSKNHMSGGTNSTKLDVVKKSNSNMFLLKKQGGSDRLSRRIVSGPITKDEEEVAETLYALAGMFPNNDADDIFKGKHESVEPNPSDVVVSNNSHPPTVGVAEKNKTSVCPPSMAAEAAAPSSNIERLPETVKVESLNELNSSHSKKLHLSPDNSVPRMNQHASSLSAKSETECDLKATSRSVKFCASSELHLDAGLKQAQQIEAPLLQRKAGTAVGSVTSIGSQVEPPNEVEESKKTGLALWLGLPPTTVLKGARVDDHPCLPSSTSKLPAWLDVAFSNSRSSSVQYDSNAKVSTITADKRLSKRCATHVYISRLIQALRMSENKDTTTLPQRPHEELNQGVLPVISNFKGVVNRVNGVVSASSLESAVAKHSPNGAKNLVLQQKFHHDHPQSALASAVSNWQKQSFDVFMSMARGGGTEVNDGSGRARNGLEPLSPLQNPYLPSFVQHQFGMPFSLAQPCYDSSACSDHLSSAQQVQMQAFYSAQASPTTALTKHHYQQQQQQLQQLLGVAHYKPDDTPKTTIQFLNLPNGAPSQRPQQQHPMSAGKVTRQDHHLPSAYEERGGGFHSSALPLQLLCTERL